LGLCLAIASVFTFSAAFTVTSPQVLQHPPNALLAALAGVGSAVFISYTVGVSRLSRQFRRGPDGAVLLGFLTGLGISGIFGVGLAVVLLGTARPFGWLGDLALAWAGSSVALLAGLVAALPLLAYEDSRIKHLNPEE
jgi:hypothetical protein